jgi:hypothetical protein
VPAGLADNAMMTIGFRRRSGKIEPTVRSANGTQIWIRARVRRNSILITDFRVALNAPMA